MQVPWLEEFLQRLPELHERLSAHHLECGADSWIAVHDLLAALSAKNRLPPDPMALAALIGPILCTNPAQQRLFPALFRDWWRPGETDAASGVKPAVGSEARLAAQSVTLPQQRRQRRWRAALALVLLLLAVLLAGLPHWINWMATGDPPPAVNTPASAQTPVQSPTLPPADNKTIPIDNWAPPRRLPEPPLTWRLPGWLPAALAGKPLLPIIAGLFPWLPALPVLVWLAGYYQRRWALRKSQANPDDVIENLRLPIPAGARLFGSVQSLAALRRLRGLAWQPTRRIHVPATVEATARRGGELQLRFRQRRDIPRYLLVVQSRHVHDQTAALAEELLQRFRDQGIEVDGFRFADDPRRVIAWSRNHPTVCSLRQLADDYGDARLIVVSGGEIIVHPLTGKPRPWLEDLARWQQRAWLHPDPLPRSLAEYLWQREILPLPLSSNSLEALSHWLTDWKPSHRHLLPANDRVPLPRALALMPERWLDAAPPHGEDVDRLLMDLQMYLHHDGCKLLAAIAAYPEARWHLSLALDYLLFQTAVPEQREQRLGKLARLPWIRHSHLPDYLRERLLQALMPSERAQVREAYAKLLALPLQAGDGPGVLSLPIAAPQPWRLWQRLRSSAAVRRWKLRGVMAHLLAAKRGPSHLEDPIFLNMLLGDRLSLLDFHLPRAVAALLPGFRWRINPWPAIGAVILLLGLSLGMEKLWQHWGENWLVQAASVAKSRANQRWIVSQRTTSQTMFLAQALGATLVRAGYRIQEPAALDNPAGENALRYPPGALQAAQALVAHVQHAAYGASIALQETAGLAGDRMELLLAKTYQAGSVFHDRLANAATLPIPAPFSVFRDAFIPAVGVGSSAPSYGPEMIVVPAGQFQMGSPDTETDRFKDEGPQHSVTIAQPFAMGRYEVTFDEYDAYVDSLATKVSRAAPGCEAVKLEKLGDNGWGRGRRPVINVDWEQARCYAAWLSVQTGQNYRLPTEAEWEYAARAGTQTPWFWGQEDTATGNYAWFTENSGSQTHEVGGKRPNAFGLYDMAGNVWEWTADCWHENYQNAPADGSVWQEANGSDCGRRVVRGGSWLYVPQGLRSAFRYGFGSDVALNNLGFRLARAL